jgi:CheY-like chemotaxis protein
VTSTPGEGARFEMLLPHCEADADADAPAAATKARAKVGETVLVVEDERGVRQIVRSVLSGNGYKVLVASGGEEALAICAGYAGSIDLVITDVVMPRMSGREFVERLHAARPGLKVLYFSGYPDEILSREGVLQQGVRLLRKPFALAELQRRVREIIDERPTERPPMAHGAHSAARPDDTRGASS